MLLFSEEDFTKQIGSQSRVFPICDEAVLDLGRQFSCGCQDQSLNGGWYDVPFRFHHIQNRLKCHSLLFLHLKQKASSDHRISRGGGFFIF